MDKATGRRFAHTLSIACLVGMIAIGSRLSTQSRERTHRQDVINAVYDLYHQKLRSSATQLGASALFSSGADISGITLDLGDNNSYEVTYWGPSAEAVISSGRYVTDKDLMTLTDARSGSQLRYRVLSNGDGLQLKAVKIPTPLQIQPLRYLPVAMPGRD
jgi:hypothetical protein